ncbi:MAG: hypothetical protein LBI48_02455, partial [Burkholderiaceae bacterium]|nr:hypothetical protein [Burkholderiaceae bacterium]
MTSSSLRRLSSGFFYGGRLICALALMLGLLAVSSLPAQAANGNFGPGSGDGSSSAQAKIIEDAGDLDAVRNGLGLYYKLAHDIDLTTWLSSGNPGYNGGAGWNPIGTYIPSTPPFTGNFNGAGHRITGLWIKRNSTVGIGLFGNTTGATIASLGVETATAGITGLSVVGGLVGLQTGGSITNSYARSNVTGTGTGSGNPDDCNSGGCAGGLVGVQAGGGSIKDSYATGDVSGTYDVGGLLGYRWGAGNIITNSYATGSVSGSSVGYVGGLLGYQAANGNSNNITDSFATGSVTSSGNYTGGLVGGWQAGSITSSYATGVVSGSGSSVGGLVGEQFSGSIVSSHATGDVSGGSSSGGNCDSYSGINSSCTGGLVGFQQSGNITNSYATGNVNGYSSNDVGGLVGRQVESGNSSIAGSYATGSVTSTGGNIGGLAGWQGGSITNSYATGSATGTGAVGGLVGGYKNGSITNSYATGNVGGSTLVGGLVGNYVAGSITASFFDKTVNPTLNGVGSGSTAGVTGKTTAEMQTRDTFTVDTHNSASAPANWDFGATISHVWYMPGSDAPGFDSSKPSGAYPILVWQKPLDAHAPYYDPESGAQQSATSVAILDGCTTTLYSGWYLVRGAFS